MDSLRVKTKKSYTIQGRLGSYLTQLLLLLSFMLITSAGFYWMASEHAAAQNRHLLELTDFFEELASVNYTLSTETSGKVSAAAYETDLQKLETGLKALESYQVSTDYKREIRELHRLLGVYRQRIAAIGVDSYQADYLKTAEVYTAMCRYEHPLRRATAYCETEWFSGRDGSYSIQRC